MDCRGSPVVCPFYLFRVQCLQHCTPNEKNLDINVYFDIIIKCKEPIQNIVPRNNAELCRDR